MWKGLSHLGGSASLHQVMEEIGGEMLGWSLLGSLGSGLGDMVLRVEEHE